MVHACTAVDLELPVPVFDAKDRSMIDSFGLVIISRVSRVMEHSTARRRRRWSWTDDELSMTLAMLECISNKCIIMDLAAPPRRVSPARADMVEDVGAAAVSAVSPKIPATATPAAEVEPADAPAGNGPNGGHIISGENRICVAHLRGSGGADFEGKAAVLRGVREKNLLAKLLPCVFGERDFVSYGEVLRYVVVKGDNCFIFTEESDPSPLYAIPLHDKVAILEDPNQPEGTSLTISPTFKNIAKEDLDTVLLKYRGSGKIAYQFTFSKRDGSNLADGFLGVVCSLKVVVGDKTSSVVCAQKVAAEKEKYQPVDPNKR